MLREFRWLSDGPVPEGYDLRLAGWALLAKAAWIDDRAARPLLAFADRLALADWLVLTRGPAQLRGRMVLLGIDHAPQRTRLLRAGFGDVLGADAPLFEIEIRAMRVARTCDAISRHRRIGTLTLDLLEREATCLGRVLGLHPREFALLWRLSDAPGEAVSQECLRRDVWQLSFRPETNTVAVHVSRLRAKLRLAGLGGLIQTLPSGAYRLAPEPLGPFLLHEAEQGRLLLDAHVRLRKVGAATDKESADATGNEA